MDALAQLESQVDKLAERLKSLKMENARLAEELAHAAQENINLATQNRALRQSLQLEESLRKDALDRLKKLLRKIHDYGASG